MKDKRSQDHGQCNLYFGYVTAVDESTGRARVRVDDLDGVESYWLNILQDRVAVDKCAYWLDPGDFVALLSDERLEAGVILGCLYTASNPPPIGTRDKYYRRFGDGAVIEYDRSSGILNLDIISRVNIRVPGGVHIFNTTVTTIAGDTVSLAGSTLSLPSGVIEESKINGKAIAVLGATDNDSESNGSNSLVTSNQL